MNDYQKFGPFLKSKRNNQEIAVRIMAERVGISAGHYCDIESGRRSPAERDFLERG